LETPKDELRETRTFIAKTKRQHSKINYQYFEKPRDLLESLEFDIPNLSYEKDALGVKLQKSVSLFPVNALFAADNFSASANVLRKML
jgi:hypothetical protein